LGLEQESISSTLKMCLCVVVGALHEKALRIDSR